jgi:hypothetical protein
LQETAVNPATADANIGVAHVFILH